MAAAVPQSLVENGARTSGEKQKAPITSHGRGGAGNIGKASTSVDPVSLETPTIKSQIYTTGRGGSGNMAKNTDPEEARKAQDVTAHPRTSSTGQQHIGRGGAANVFKPSKEELDAAKKDAGKWESAVGGEEKDGKDAAAKDHGSKNILDKGKEFLFGKK